MCAPTTRRSPPRWPATSPTRGRRQHQVRAGDVIARIDDGDYRLAVDSARDKVATQQATVERIGRQIVAQQAAVEQAKAQLVSAQAGAGADAARTRPPAGAGRQGIRQPADARAGAVANRDQAVAAVQSAQAAIDAAQTPMSTCSGAAAGGGAHARRTEDRAGQGRARSVVHGDPRAGRRRDRQPRRAARRFRADRPAAREPRAARRRLYRRQLQGDAARAPAARPAGRDHGRRAARRRRSKARSQSVAPASGSVFSLLPPDNATGNFTKIVQRLPVRIRVPADVAGAGAAAARHVGGGRASTPSAARVGCQLAPQTPRS